MTGRTFRYDGHPWPMTLNPPVVEDARGQPSRIDTLLRPFLYDEKLPSHLTLFLREYTVTLRTPDYHIGDFQDRPRYYYANCLIYGMLLGRAYKLLSTPIRPPRSLSTVDFPFSQLPAELRLHIWEYCKEDSAQRKRLWDSMSDVFIKTFWSASNPEEGARYITGVLLLTCGHALSNSSAFLLGRGKQYVWWNDECSRPDETWDWKELKAAVMETVKLPRSDIATVKESFDRWNEKSRTERIDMGLSEPVFVSEHIITVLDLAREHLKSGERDWTPPELVAKCLNPLFENKHDARKIWEATGMVPHVYE